MTVIPSSGRAGAAIAAAASVLTVLGCAAGRWHPPEQSESACPLGGTSPAMDLPAEVIVGTYRLRMTGGPVGRRQRDAQGTLRLEPTDSLHRYGERPLGGRVDSTLVFYPVWGTAEIDLDSLGVPGAAIYWRSLNPDDPGVLGYREVSEGRYRLDFGVGWLGGGVMLAVEQVSPLGFKGRWEVAELEPAVRGSYCALRGGDAVPEAIPP